MNPHLPDSREETFAPIKHVKTHARVNSTTNLQISIPSSTARVKNHPHSADCIPFPFLFLLSSLPPRLQIFLSSSFLPPSVFSSFLLPLPPPSLLLPLLPFFCFVPRSFKTNPRCCIFHRNTSLCIRACAHNLCITCPSWEGEQTEIKPLTVSQTCPCPCPLAKGPGVSRPSGEISPYPRGLRYSSHVRSAYLDMQMEVAPKREIVVKSVHSGSPWVAWAVKCLPLA